MHVQMKSLHDNNIWDLIKKLIGTRIPVASEYIKKQGVLGVKKCRFKVRLVVRDFSQR